MFDKFVGNNQIKSVLRRMLAKKQIPGAMIFSGDEGVGKRLFALELAKAVLCRNPINLEACDKCQACLRAVKFPKFPSPEDKNKDEYQKVFWSEHADVGMVIPYKNSILVDAVRDLVEQANLAPYEGAARFFIIDSAEKLNTTNDSAGNALLKTLEEPAPTTNLILLSSRPNALLQTIRSRCQILRFAPVPASEIEKHLLETKKFSPNDVKLAARVARGSLGCALALNIELYKQQREQMLGVLDALVFSHDRGRLLRVAEELNDAKLKDEYENRLEVLQTLIRDVWALCLDIAPEKTVNADLQNKLVKFAEAGESANFQKWLAEIETLRQNLTNNLNRKIAADALLMRLASI